MLKSADVKEELAKVDAEIAGHTALMSTISELTAQRAALRVVLARMEIAEGIRERSSVFGR